ncbi:glutaminyl-peptide cyclotransferase [Roseateles sp. SL47]|uniref:glutaminyl-peptide cyclotransferase n=1 Tax=Roseateles sp. SL47 TaxID=2995138 RepID=UPI0022704EAA|nr:glutaminyl-peptide cyclotransferase [Roseateles sp. SL47]WAC71197.1 glutaminyl-peptide cyclotransferase [Roseateles sp. SL47]
MRTILSSMGRRALISWAGKCLLATGALALHLQAPAADASIPIYTVKVVKAYPHDRGAFTEGLFFKEGFLYESTGLKGHSTIRKVKLETGEVVMDTSLPAEVFGEGITHWGDRIIGLTWTDQVGYVLDASNFKLWRKFSYGGEGWGITQNGRELIMSDGTPELRFIDPVSFKETRRVRVTAGGKPVEKLNELEWVDGEVLANIWQTERIARIDPASGKVTGWIDLTGLMPERNPEAQGEDVANGIAYDAKTKRLFVTGKLWPKLFEVQLVKGGAGPRR